MADTREKDEKHDPTVEDAYWRQHYSSRPYARAGKAYDAYQPAYRVGWEGAGRYGELNWDSAEPRLRDDFDAARGDSQLSWDDARSAAKDAWERIRPGVDYSKENR